MINSIQFFTATCLNWQTLLQADERKQILIDSLKLWYMIKGFGFMVSCSCPTT